MKLRQLGYSFIASIGLLALSTGQVQARGGVGLPILASLGDAVNEAIDNLHSVAERSLELPLFIPMGALVAFALVLVFITRRLARKRKTPLVSRWLLAGEGLLMLFAVLFLVDRKIARLEVALIDLRSKTTQEAAALLRAVKELETRQSSLIPEVRHSPPIPEVRPAAPVPEVNPPPSVPEPRRTSFFVHPAEAQQALAQQFPGVSVQSLLCDEATDFVQLQFPTPLVSAYLAIVDLRNPRVEIKVGGDLKVKTLTSTFARENRCTVAINGEAGLSPNPGSGLGQWSGYYVQQGKLLLDENPQIPRPYLSFDRSNHPRYTSMTAANRVPGVEQFNAIWGRFDLILNGLIQSGDTRPQPRTAMAVNQAGTLLYLLVVDGRQPNYSNGFTHAQMGQCLKAFGAFNGMLCDQGGSSCMYLEQIGGIANVPSDGQGVERVTYTHFGVALRAKQ